MTLHQGQVLLLSLWELVPGWGWHVYLCVSKSASQMECKSRSMHISCLASATPKVGVDDELDRVGGGGDGDERARRQESEQCHLHIALKTTAVDCSHGCQMAIARF